GSLGRARPRTLSLTAFCPYSPMPAHARQRATSRGCTPRFCGMGLTLKCHGRGRALKWLASGLSRRSLPYGFRRKPLWRADMGHALPERRVGGSGTARMEPLTKPLGARPPLSGLAQSRVQRILKLKQASGVISGAGLLVLLGRHVLRGTGQPSRGQRRAGIGWASVPPTGAAAANGRRDRYATFSVPSYAKLA